MINPVYEQLADKRNNRLEGTHDGDDFDTGENEFCFAIRASTQCINGDYDNQAHGDPHGIVNIFFPIIDQNSSRGKLCWKNLK